MPYALTNHPQHYNLLRCIYFFACSLISGGSLQAETYVEQQKPVIELEFKEVSSSDVIRAEASTSKADEMKNGLISISRIQLQGDVLYPEYGFTEEFLFTRVNQVFSHMSDRLSISDMNVIADALTLAYREKGLTFNQAYVIPQEIVNSTLTIHVLKGTLSDIDIYNNKIYKTEQLIAPFSKLLGQVIYEDDIKKAVKSLNDQPGLKIFSFFSVGSNQGEARLNIKVMEETRHYSKLVIDNKGVNQTGMNRLMYSHIINNPFESSGQLQATLLLTNKQNNFYGSLGYNRPINFNNQVGLSIFRSDFAVTGQFSDLGLTGDLSGLAVSWANTPEHKKNTSVFHNRRLSVSTKQSSVSSKLFPEFLNEEVDYTTLSGVYQLRFLNPWETNSQHILALEPALSRISNTNNTTLPSSFWLTKISYDFISPQWIPNLQYIHPFSVSVTGQYTNKHLPSSEQLTTTGAVSNRGFEAGIFSGDKAYTLSVEQGLNWPFDITNDQQALSLKPFIFYDYSYGEQDQVMDLSAKFQSAGLGLKANYKDFAKGNITIGHPLDHKTSGQVNIDRKRPVIYADLSVSF